VGLKSRSGRGGERKEGRNLEGRKENGNRKLMRVEELNNAGRSM
jgi:hypothetical protein